MAKIMNYTWQQALATLAPDADQLTRESAAAETFLRAYIRELEAGRPTAEELKRVAEFVERVAIADGFCLSTYTGPQGRLECDRRRHHTGAHSADVPTAGGVVGWDDAEQDGARCPVTTPKPCVLEIRHPGSHRSNSGTMWPALVPKPETTQREQPTTGARPSPEAPRTAPTHPGPTARLPEENEVTCGRYNLVTPTRPSPQCVLVKWHDGPHMDQTAVSHAGKAGEVWE